MDQVTLLQKNPSLGVAGLRKNMMNEYVYATILKKLQEAELLVEDLQADGQLHRCGTLKNPHGQDGAYIVHLDPPFSLWWQNWQTGQTGTWCAKSSDNLSSEERRVLAARIAEDRRKTEEARQKQYLEAEKKAQKLWAKAEPITGQAHPYLQKKCIRSYGLRALGGFLVIPVFKEQGVLQSIQRVDKDGTKLFLSGGKTKAGYYYITSQNGYEDQPICVAEGYATGATIREATGFGVLVAFSAGNLLLVAQMAHKLCPKRQIVVCADFDDPSEQYSQAGGVGLAKAAEAAESIGGYLAVPEMDGRKCDFNDVAQARGLVEVKRQIVLSLQKRHVTVVTCNKPRQLGEKALHVPVTSSQLVVTASCNMPKGFFFVEEGGKTGLWYEMEQAGQNSDGSPKDPVKIYLGPKLEVVAQSRDVQSEGWSKLCLWHDPKGVEHRRLIPMAAVTRSDTGPWLSEILASGGWFPAATKGVSILLKRFLLECSPTKFVRQVKRSGWHGAAFVTPSFTLGVIEKEEVLFDCAIEENMTFEEAGTLEGWQASIGQLSKGNSRLIFSIAAAFASVLIGPCGAESGGVVLVGGSSSGKTTCLQAAASAWGRGSESGGYLRSWRATANGLESVASEVSDCLLCLDELGQVDAQEVGAITYMLANGQGKSRAKRDGNARKIKNWRSFVLSTGELTVKQMIESCGKRVKAGQDVRLICIPADAGAGLGAFEDLHGYQDAGSFARVIKNAACEHYGHAAKAFIRAFQAHREEATKDFKAAMSGGLSILFPSESTFKASDGQVLRVAQRILLVGLAGEAAAEWGIVPWEEGEALGAAKRCFSDWLAERGSVGAAEDEAIVHDVLAFLEQNSQSCFQDWENFEEKVIQRVGFRKIEDYHTIFYVLPTGFEKICAGHNPARAKKILFDRGLLIKKDRNAYASNMRLPGIGNTRCYILSLGSEGGCDEMV